MKCKVITDDSSYFSKSSTPKKYLGTRPHEPHHVGLQLCRWQQTKNGSTELLIRNLSGARADLRSLGFPLLRMRRHRQKFRKRYSGQKLLDELGSEASQGKGRDTGVEVFIGSKVQCLFCSESCTTEGRGEKREGVQISKQST